MNEQTDSLGVALSPVCIDSRTGGLGACAPTKLSYAGGQCPHKILHYSGRHIIHVLVVVRLVKRSRTWPSQHL